MDSERYAQLRELFHKVAPLTGEERKAALHRIKAEQPSIAAHLEDLLADNEKPQADVPIHFRSDLLASVGREQEDIAMQGFNQLGRYRLLRPVGQGSMGRVYEAVQEQPHRKVALKLVHATSASERRLSRFAGEIELLGRLEHPAIARIYESDAITTSTGVVHYFAMEWIDGPTLQDWLLESKPAVRERLKVFRGVCAGVAEAHARGVVHRDLKPTNIMVDGDGLPKIVDFGVSRLAEPAADWAHTQTRAGELLGTLQYMSPEQLSGDPGAVDTRTDVYSLGVVLFEVLTGELPRNTSSMDLLPAIEELRRARVRRLAEVKPSMDRDLSMITSKALELNPSDRYASVRELDEDVGRYLRSEPILARPASFGRRFALLIRRRRRTAALVFLAVVGLVISMIVILRFASIADEQARQASVAKELADRESYRARVTAAYSALRAGDVATARAQLNLMSDRPKSWELRFLAHRLDSSSLVLRGHLNQIHDVAFARDGRSVVTVGGALFDPPHEQALRCWDLPSGELRYTRLLDKAQILHVACHPSEDLFVTGGPEQDPAIRLWSLSTGEALGLLDGHSQHIAGLEFAVDGERLYSADSGGRVLSWARNAEGKFALERELGSSLGQIEALCILEKQLFTIAKAGPLAIWNLETTAPPVLHDLSGQSLACHEDQVAIGTEEGFIDIYLQSLGMARSARLDAGVSVLSLVFGPDGSTLFGGGKEGRLRLWDTNTGRLRAAFAGHSGWLWSLAIDSQGSRLATGSADNTARLWSIEELTRELRLDKAGFMPPVEMRDLDLADEGSLIGMADLGGAARLISATTLEQVAEVRTSAPYPQAIALDAKGERFAYDERGVVFLGDTARAQDSKPVGKHAASVVDLCWLPNQDRFCSASVAGEVALWQVTPPRELHRWQTGLSVLWKIAVDPAGKRIACVGEDGPIEVRKLDGELLLTLTVASGLLEDVQWNPSGSRIATSGTSGQVQIWNTETGALDQQFDLGETRLPALCFNSDGTRLFVAGNDRVLRVFDLQNGDSLLTLPEFPEVPSELRCDPRTDDLWVAMPKGLRVLRTGSAGQSSAPR